jgi:hypothetical protein
VQAHFALMLLLAILVSSVALTNTFVVVLFSHVLATQVIDCKWKKVLRCRKAKFASIKAKKESLFFGAAADQEFLVLNL